MCIFLIEFICICGRVVILHMCILIPCIACQALTVGLYCISLAPIRLRHVN